MSLSDYFLSANPAEPWNLSAVGWPALAAVAAGLIALTLWTYRGLPFAGRRVGLVLALRLGALAVAVLTAVRPSVGVQEDPKLPSALIVGIDLSESMTVPDELNNQPRIAAVRKVLERCEPTLAKLRDEQNVEVALYGFGSPDFTDASRYDPNAPANIPRSDYGTFLGKTFDRWQAERFVRGCLVVGDGQDNGTRTSADAEAARWRRAGRAVHTFAVGTTTIDNGAKDVALKSAAVTTGNPDGSVYVKTKFTLKVVIDAPGFEGATPRLIASIDEGNGYKAVETQRPRLEKTRGNEFDLTIQAPDRPGEYKLKVEVPVEDVVGDVAPSNNVIETYLTVTKEGMRVLLVGRASFELAGIRRALESDRRIDLFPVIRQTDDPPAPDVREDFDFDKQGYDVIVLANVSGRQIQTIDPALPQKLADQVLKRGTGLLLTGGHAAFPEGAPVTPDATGWAGVRPIEDILPVDLRGPTTGFGPAFTDANARLQYLPTPRAADHYLNRLGDTREASLAQWRRLNSPPDPGRFARLSRFTGLSRVGSPKGTATVFAVASADRVLVPDDQADPARLPPALVGHQPGGTGSRGRVLVLAVQDTLNWTRLGQPKASDGLQLHARYWRQLVRWLAHQEEDEGAAFARPDWRRGPVGTKQGIRVGLRAPGGVPVPNPKFTVKVVAPGETPEMARQYQPVTDADGGYRVPYDPAAPGEYTVTLSASGTDAAGKEVKGDATARFLVYAEASDELLRKAADHDALRRIATAGGGKFHRLEDLPRFLQELAAQPLDTMRPKPKYLPDWRRDHSGGFLPAWLVLFAALLGAEWGLRRVWGLVYLLPTPCAGRGWGVGSRPPPVPATR
ncbi:MAG: carboxypeptidase-like regulatory domain-containing protein [Gemmataceae bacterium]